LAQQRRDLYGTLVASDASFAILVSVPGFTKGVREFVKRNPSELVDLDDRRCCQFPPHPLRGIGPADLLFPAELHQRMR
jgi:hypothetical protein